jgi:hypothetical protein
MDYTSSNPGEPVSQRKSHGHQPEASKCVMSKIDVRMRHESVNVCDPTPVGNAADDKERDDRRERPDDSQLDGLDQATSPWTFSPALRNA